MKYKIGVCQFEPKLLQVKQNLQRMEELVNEVEADLIVLPELATSGYVFNNTKEVENIAEDAFDGATANLFKKLAKQNNCNFVVGIAEKYEGKIYNSSLLIHKSGKIDIYRKAHLFYEEKKWFTSGDTGFKVFSTEMGIKVGMMICFDWIFPEATRTLAIKGAQIIAHPSNLVLPWCQQSMITRSLENRVFSITANRIGLEKNDEKQLRFTGMAQMLNTKGEILHRFNETEEGVFVAEIDPQNADDKWITEYNHIFEDRKTEFYG
ncbi:MAG: nitrilase-related carbon-nitrogen hydrolase [Candidatus Cloacimonadota bacterium]|nr:nitrilase-related carbon-nitrogen hydrolase [Candidatus Cloacimonadota bacterium]